MTKSKTETEAESKPGGQLYLLQDGTHADAGDVSADKAGVLRHKNGLAVALYADGSPQTVSEDAVRNKNVEAAKLGEDNVSGEVRPVGTADVANLGSKPRKTKAD